jgi:hypothetical protein
MKVTLHNAQQAAPLIDRIRDYAKAELMAGRRVVLEAKQPSRKEVLSRKFHAICGDLERSRFEWAGKPRTRDQWKVLLVSGHAVATRQETEIVPGLEGEFINVRESTALMSTERAASLVEYAVAFCAANRIPTMDDMEVYA